LTQKKNPPHKVQRIKKQESSTNGAKERSNGRCPAFNWREKWIDRVFLTSKTGRASGRKNVQRENVSHGHTKREKPDGAHEWFYRKKLTTPLS